jgi:hypothetical protein
MMGERDQGRREYFEEVSERLLRARRPAQSPLSPSPTAFVGHTLLVALSFIYYILYILLSISTIHGTYRSPERRVPVTLGAQTQALGGC